MDDAERQMERLALLSELTGREAEVLALRAGGKAIPDIAAELHVTDRTVNFHLGNVYAKLGLTALSQGERQLEIGRYGEALADVRQRGLLREHLGNGGDAPEPPGGALMAALEDEAAAKARPIAGSAVPAAPPGEPEASADDWQQRGWDWQRRGWDWLRAAGPQGPLPDDWEEAPPRARLGSVPLTPEYREAMAALCEGGATMPQLARLAALGVTPEYVHALRDAGLASPAAGLLADLCAVGVTPEYVRSLRQLGVGGLTPESLHTLGAASVSLEYVRRLRAEGWTDLTADRVWSAWVTSRSPAQVPAS